MDQMLDMLGQPPQRDPAEAEEEPRRPRRRGTARRRTAPREELVDTGAGMPRDEERRIQDWANDIG